MGGRPDLAERKPLGTLCVLELNLMHTYTPVVRRCVALATFTLFAIPASADGTEASPLSPDQAVELALTLHPDVREAEAALATARASRSASAMLLGNPEASGWSTLDGSRAELSAMQPFSLSGEGWHARRAASASVTASAAHLARARRQVAADTRRAYISATVAIGQVHVARNGADLAGRLHFAITRKHEEGEASALDLRLARLAQTRAATDLLMARRTEAEALRNLASWTLRPIGLKDLEEDPLAAAPKADGAIPAERADVEAATADLAAARAELARQRAATFAPVTFGATVAIEDQATFVGPAVAATIPLFNRNQVGTRAAKGAWQVAQSRLARVTARSKTEQRTARQRVDEAEQLADALGDDALDEARAALASIEAGVLAGEVDLLTAILLQSQVLDGQSAIVTHQGLVAEARIDLLLALDHNTLLGGVQ